MEEYSGVNMLLEKGGGRGGHRRKRKAKIKYDFRLLLCCRIWVAVKGVGQRSNLILFRKITVFGVWWMVWREMG